MTQQQQITFARIKDPETREPVGWGLRGAKSHPDEPPPEEGAEVVVMKRDGSSTDAVMGRVIAQGDDWWLAHVGRKHDTRPPGLRIAQQPEPHQAATERPVGGELVPPFDPKSNNYTERRLAREQEEATDRAQDEAIRAEAQEGGDLDWSW